MNESQKKKLLKAKAKQETVEAELGYFTDDQIKAIHSDIETIKGALAEALTYERDDLIAAQKESLGEIDTTLKEFASRLQDSLNAHEPQPITLLTPELDQAVKRLVKVSEKELPQPKEVQFPSWLASDKSIKEVIRSLDSVAKSLDVKPGQQPTDFVPMRRVMKVGNKLMYDDSFYTGGGGGSSIPTKNGSVPVVNPDGSNIGGSGTVTNDGTFATPAKQDTGNTSVASIDTKTPSLGQALAAGSTPVVLTAAQVSTLTPQTNALTDTQLRATPVPISGTITATGVATAVKQSDGSQKTQIVDPGGTNVLSIDSTGALPIQSGGLTGSAVPTRAVQIGGSDGTNLRAVKVSSTGVVSVDGSAVTQPVSGTVTATPTGTQDVNQKQVNGATINVGAGAASTGTQRVITSTDSTIATITNVVHVDDNAGSLTVDGTVAATQSGTWNVTNVSGTVSLPTGAATSALQTTGNSSLSSIDSKLSGTLTTDEAPLTTLTAFVTPVTTAGTRVQLASNVTDGGVLQAPSTNSGLIYVGSSNVSSTVYGAELQPGQATGIAIDNTNKIYIDSSVNGDKCAFLGSS